MRVEIRVRDGEVSSALGDQIERRLGFAFGRFGSRVRRVVVHLKDVNGPRGGEDQYCRIEVNLVPSGTIMAEATDAEIASAVSRAAERVARRVRDALDRKRTMWARTGSRGRRVAILCSKPLLHLPSGVTTVRIAAEPALMARQLYARLREADALGVDAILVIAPLSDGLGLAIHDRLRRAAGSCLADPGFEKERS